MVIFKILTCQNRQCVHRSLMIWHYDSTVIRLDLEKILLIYIFESLHRRGENMSLNMHRTHFSLSQHNRILQDVEV